MLDTPGDSLVETPLLSPTPLRGGRGEGGPPDTLATNAHMTRARGGER